MGTVLFIIFAVLVLVNMSNKSETDKKKKKKKKRSSWGGKSDWEKTCDDGGKFFNW